MLDLTLLSHSSTSARTGENITAPPISHSRRAAILTYASPLIDVSSKVSFMPLYILGWKREAEQLLVRMMEGVEFSRGAHNIPETLRLELHSHETMQVYSAKVTFRTRFTGLRYVLLCVSLGIYLTSHRWIMYHWRIPSFFVFSFMFWSVSMFSLSISWVLVAGFFNSEVPVDEIKAEDESESEPTIKEEEEPSEKFGMLEFESSTEHSEKESGANSDDDISRNGQRKDQKTPEAGPSEAAGSGTATEGAEASGLQRRRRLVKQEDT